MSVQVSESTHLHVHSQYSLLDGAIRLKDLFPKLASLGMNAVALTDHGNMFGAVDFYKRAKAATPKDKRTAMVSFLAKVHATIDAIMEFELDSVVDAISEISGEDFTPKGRGQAAKELAAATELFRVAFATDD